LHLSRCKNSLEQLLGLCVSASIQVDVGEVCNNLKSVEVVRPELRLSLERDSLEQLLGLTCLSMDLFFVELALTFWKQRSATYACQLVAVIRDSHLRA
jgi:hypothetical protein